LLVSPHIEFIFVCLFFLSEFKISFFVLGGI
jgi:hypothetical protein